MLPRLNRLFAADGRCLDVAVDHGFFNEGAFLSGIEDMRSAVATLVDAAPDAIQLSPGQAPLLQHVPGPRKPALVLRPDVANVLRLPDQPELLGACVRNVMALRAACTPAGMPLMVEPLVFKPGAGGYGVDGDAEKIVPLVRQAAELGADIIKADPTDDIADYHRVIQAAGGRPVLPRG